MKNVKNLQNLTTQKNADQKPHIQLNCKLYSILIIYKKNLFANKKNCTSSTQVMAER